MMRDYYHELELLFDTVRSNWPEFKDRAGQIEMARFIIEAFMRADEVEGQRIAREKEAIDLERTKRAEMLTEETRKLREEAMRLPAENYTRRMAEDIGKSMDDGGGEPSNGDGGAPADPYEKYYGGSEPGESDTTRRNLPDPEFDGDSQPIVDLSEYEGVAALIEGPTGIGKSFAYIAAGILFAISERRKLYISSSTLTLQDQLFNKDLPAFKKYSGIDFKYVLLKGRSNYLCPDRMDELIAENRWNMEELFQVDESDISDKRRAEIKRIVINAKRDLDNGRINGLVEEVDGFLGEFRSEVVSTRRTCNTGSCRYYKNDRCPFYNARKAAKKADVIVVNHYLLVSDMALGLGSILPEVKNALFCVDEAHKFADVAARSMASSLPLIQFARNLGRIDRQAVREAYEAIDISKGDTNFMKSVKELAAACHGLADMLTRRLIEKRSRKPGGSFVTEAQLNTWIWNEDDTFDEAEKQVINEFSMRADLSFEVVDKLRTRLVDLVNQVFEEEGENAPSLKGIKRHLMQVSQIAEEIEKAVAIARYLIDKTRQNETMRKFRREDAPLVDLENRIIPNDMPIMSKLSIFSPRAVWVELGEVLGGNKYGGRKSKRRDAISEAADNVDKGDFDEIREFIQDSGKAKDVIVSGSHTTVADLLYHRLWTNTHAVIMTSATLRSSGSFESAKQELGLSLYRNLDRLGEQVLQSPFDHSRIPFWKGGFMKWDPVSNTRGHTEEITRYLDSHILWDDKNPNNATGTLVIFTSKKQMEEVYLGLSDNLKRIILKQGDGERAKLIEEHKRRIDAMRPSVIFGLDSFAEGLDLALHYCVEVIVCKIPFLSPTDPLNNTMQDWLDRFESWSFFTHVSIPKASIKLIQATGRLMRTENDYGQILVLDKRLVTKNYRNQLLKGFPNYNFKD